MDILVAPSILSADFGRLNDEITALSLAGADWIHIDVMDGQFVPNLTIGPPVIKKLRNCTSKPFDVHLMIIKPEKMLDSFIEAGADYLTVHFEAARNCGEIINLIHNTGKKAGISVKPATPVEHIRPFLDELDLVLVMSVEPGFSGQKFIPEVVSKISQLKSWRLDNPEDYEFLIEVDGGIDNNTVELVKEAGADVIVSGSYIFSFQDYKVPIARLRKQNTLNL